MTCFPPTCCAARPSSTCAVRTGATEPLRDLSSTAVLLLLLLSWPWWAARAIPLFIPAKCILASGPAVARAQAALASLDVAGLARPALVVHCSKQISAITTGTRHSSIIGVSTALVDAMNDTELRAVIAHELGHLHAGHLVMTSGFLGVMLLAKTLFGALGPPMTIVLLLVFLAILRRNEFEFEFEADAYAASLVGNRTMIDPFAWLKVLLKELAIVDWPMMSVLSTHPGYRVRAHCIEKLAKIVD
jgi:Zn-dependent protease with chaperone function